MAKRKKNRKSNAPNLPASALDRARRQAAGESLEPETETEAKTEIETGPSAAEIEETKVAAARAAAALAAPTPKAPPIKRAEALPRPERTSLSSRREGRATGTTRRRSSDRATINRRERDKEAPNADMIEASLLRPTRHVTEEELRAEYSYVLMDIRNMLVLAVVLMVALVALAQFI